MGPWKGTLVARRYHQRCVTYVVFSVLDLPLPREFSMSRMSVGPRASNICVYGPPQARWTGVASPWRDASSSPFSSSTMSDPPKPPPTQRKSRVLAALDNPDFLYNAGQTSLPPVSGTPLPPGSLGHLQTPVKQRLVTPAPSFDYGTSFLGLVGSSQLKRRTPDDGFDEDSDEFDSSPARPRPSQLTARQGFNLNYDKEGAVGALDRGGPYQEMKWVCCVFLV